MKKHVLKMYFILLLLGSSVGLLKAQNLCRPTPNYPLGSCTGIQPVLKHVTNNSNCPVFFLWDYATCPRRWGAGIALPGTDIAQQWIACGLPAGSCTTNNIAIPHMTPTHFPWFAPCALNGPEWQCEYPVGLLYYDEINDIVYSLPSVGNFIDYPNPCLNCPLGGGIGIRRITAAFYPGTSDVYYIIDCL